MKNVFVMITVLLLFSACTKQNTENITGNITGNYTGTFQRVSPTGFHPQASVTLNLNNGSFSGQSSNARYPAICHGSYSVATATINFENACVWTANFDWTLTLCGTFQYEINGSVLKIWRQQGNITDTYILTKSHNN